MEISISRNMGNQLQEIWRNQVQLFSSLGWSALSKAFSYFETHFGIVELHLSEKVHFLLRIGKGRSPSIEEKARAVEFMTSATKLMTQPDELYAQRSKRLKCVSFDSEKCSLIPSMIFLTEPNMYLPTFWWLFSEQDIYFRKAIIYQILSALLSVSSANFMGGTYILDPTKKQTLAPPTKSRSHIREETLPKVLLDRIPAVFLWVFKFCLTEFQMLFLRVFKFTLLKFHCWCEREINVWISAKQGGQFMELEQNTADIIVNISRKGDTNNIDNVL